MNAPQRHELDTFRDRLDAFGADLSRWPAAPRAAAQALLERSADARALRDAAARVDALLAPSPIAPPDDALRAAVLAGIPRRRPGAAPRRAWFAQLARDLDDALGGWRVATSALGLSAVLGVMLAMDTNPVNADEPDLLDLAQTQVVDLEY